MDTQPLRRSRLSETQERLRKEETAVSEESGYFSPSISGTSNLQQSLLRTPIRPRPQHSTPRNLIEVTKDSPISQPEKEEKHTELQQVQNPHQIAKTKRHREGDHIQGTRKHPCITITPGPSCDIRIVSSEHDISEESGGDFSNVKSPIKVDSCLDKSAEYGGYERHGLGRTIDLTKEKPWKHRGTYQVRKVNSSNIAESDESNQVNAFSKVTKSRWDFQVGAEASITNPKIPIRASVAVDLARSSESRMLFRGKVIYKRTITLQNHELMETPEAISQLKKDIEEVLRDKPDSVAIECCIKILEEKYGGTTHYISSITLGAMEFSMEEYSGNEISTSTKTSIGIDGAASVEGKVNYESTNSRTSTYDKKIGRMNEEEEVLQEGVVEYKCTPITVLFEDNDHREHVAEAVKRYMRQRRNYRKGINGPYSIRFMIKENGKIKYWKVESAANRSGKLIQVTNNAKECSWFYIEKDDEAKFMITTSEDGRPTEYPRNPLYVQLEKVKGKLQLKVAPLAEDSSVLFEVYHPKEKKEDTKDGGIDEPDWLPDDLSAEGKECYLEPQSLSGFFQSVKSHFIRNVEKSTRCLNFNTVANGFYLLPPEECVKFTFTSKTA